MTTIAARKIPANRVEGITGGWEIASDSQETIEGIDSGDIKLPCQKLFVFNRAGHKLVVATAGDSGAGLAFIKHIVESSPYEVDKSRGFECLVVGQDGKLLLYDEDLLPTEITLPFYAIGTGRMAAFAAMEHGATAKEAVETAAKYDPYTGGRIVTERVP